MRYLYLAILGAWFGYAQAGELTVLQSRLFQKKSVAVLEVAVRNATVQKLFPVVWVDVYDQNRQHVGRFRSTRTRVAAGARNSFQIELKDLPQGRYSALVVGHFLSGPTLDDRILLLGHIPALVLPLGSEPQVNIVKPNPPHARPPRLAAKKE